MNSDVPVSVIVPCYNCALTLERAIKSILRQTRVPKEIILVDDASSDGTRVAIRELVSRHSHLVTAIYMECNGGPSAARNHGWAAATQPYVAFLDADDTWHSRKVELQYGWMAQHPEASMCGHLCTQQNNGSEEPEISSQMRIRSIGIRTLVFSNPFSTPSVMLRRDIVQRFPEYKRYCEDYHLWLSIAAGHGQVYRIESVLAWYHKAPYGASGLSGALWRMEKGELDAIFSVGRQRQLPLLLLWIALFFSLAKYAWRFFRTTIGNPGRK